jgi:hypothetical protein
MLFNFENFLIKHIHIFKINNRSLLQFLFSMILRDFLKYVNVNLQIFHRFIKVRVFLWWVIFKSWNHI